MAQASGTKAPGRTGPKPAQTAAPIPANDQGELKLAALARAILSRELRPRTADIRRLAEAVLAMKAKKKDKKAKKLARIPGQKAKK